MTRCEAFYEKWKRDPNWCNKCPSAVWQINRYIELMQKYPAIKYVSENAARPLMEKKMDENVRDRIAAEIDGRLGAGLKVDHHIVANLKKQFTNVKKEVSFLNEIDTGVKFYCKHCGNNYIIIHEGPDKHRFQKVQVL